MKMVIQQFYLKSLVWCLFLISGVCQQALAAPVFKPEELEQIAAPVALYPDSLLSQVLMASTYPLEVVQAQRWLEANKSLAGDALAIALEEQRWDPSVKSLINFPPVLAMMSEKLEWTQKLGDAFLAHQKEMMHAIQELREKAIEQGSLRSTQEQIVSTKNGMIVIEYANPETGYVPAYDPYEVYGDWPYSAYPPYYYYPPGYIDVDGSPRIAFGVGIILGAAWGYAWGDCDWDGGYVDIDIDRNLGRNDRIDRAEHIAHYRDAARLDQGGKGIWQHNPENRKGVAYRDPATAQKYNRAAAADAVKAREAYRGRAEQGRQDMARGDADRYKSPSGVGPGGNMQPSVPARTRDMSDTVSNRGGAFDGVNRAASPARAPGVAPAPIRPSGPTAAMNRSNVPVSYNRSAPSYRGNAFDGINSGSMARNYSSRGGASLQGVSRPTTGVRPSGGGRGGGRR